MSFVQLSFQNTFWPHFSIWQCHHSFDLSAAFIHPRCLMHRCRCLLTVQLKAHFNWFETASIIWSFWLNWSKLIRWKGPKWACTSTTTKQISFVIRTIKQNKMMTKGKEKSKKGEISPYRQNRYQLLSGIFIFAFSQQLLPLSGFWYISPFIYRECERS